MDPQALFDNLIGTFIPMKQWDKAYNALAELFVWLQGGNAPTVPPKTYISIGNGSAVCYSILSNLQGGATFIRYDYDRRTGQMEETYKVNT